ncbi:MAG: 2-hydroxychromene-2-carboxylate isomerase [Burkholderiaceae bacterium]
MGMNVAYYFAPQSPWTYLGHQRFVAMALASGAEVEVLPVDLGRIFPISGGLPLGKRAPQRQAYRLQELRRFSGFLGLAMNVQPPYFPVAGDPAARLITAAAQTLGSSAALRLTGAVLSAVWAEQRDIADAATLGRLLEESGLPGQLLEQSGSAAVQGQYESATQRAIDAGVFGAPTWAIEGELFWGQDRLDFVARRLGLA